MLLNDVGMWVNANVKRLEKGAKNILGFIHISTSKPMRFRSASNNWDDLLPYRFCFSNIAVVFPGIDEPELG